MLNKFSFYSPPVPDAEESTRFLSDKWDKPVKHKENPEWLRNVEEELTGLGVQDNIHIEVTKMWIKQTV